MCPFLNQVDPAVPLRLVNQVEVFPAAHLEQPLPRPVKVEVPCSRSEQRRKPKRRPVEDKLRNFPTDEGAVDNLSCECRTLTQQNKRTYYNLHLRRRHLLATVLHNIFLFVSQRILITYQH